MQAGVRKNRKQKNRMSHRQQAEEARIRGRKNGADELATMTETQV